MTMGLIIRWIARAAGLVTLGVVGAAGAYAGIAFALVLFPSGAAPAPDADGHASDRITAYVVSNGVHADLVLPVGGKGQDWTRVFSLQAFRRPPARPAYVAVGWGDREFYLETPTWADLTVERAIGALASRNPAVLHVTYLERAPWFGDVRTLSLTPDQHARLAGFVLDGLPRRGGAAIPLPGYGYGNRDAFFEARGRYSALDTCNVWTGRALRTAGVKVSRWTPFAETVLWHLPKAQPE